jgi:hypothetical protein
MTDMLPRWSPLPGDPPALRSWLTARQSEQAAMEPLPPVPDEEPGYDGLR